MANNFSNDSNCVALYRMENGALKVDSKGTNDFTTGNAADSDTGDFMEGSACANFEASNSDYYYIADADTSDDFPFKDGTSNNKISVCFWFKQESGYTSAGYVLAKYIAAAGGRSWGVCFTNTNQLAWYIGYNSGGSFETLNSNWGAETGKWYHVGMTYDGDTKYWTIYVWNATDDVEAVDAAGIGKQTMHINAVNISLGKRYDGSIYYDGRIDELVIFNDILTQDEIDAISMGTYGSRARSQAIFVM